jgi:hypothetical protein
MLAKVHKWHCLTSPVPRKLKVPLRFSVYINKIAKPSSPISFTNLFLWTVVVFLDSWFGWCRARTRRWWWDGLTWGSSFRRGGKNWRTRDRTTSRCRPRRPPATVTFSYTTSYPHSSLPIPQVSAFRTWSICMTVWAETFWETFMNACDGFGDVFGDIGNALVTHCQGNPLWRRWTWQWEPKRFLYVRSTYPL